MNMNTGALRKPMSRVEATNAFLRSVYNWMAIGLGLTAVVSFALTYTSYSSILASENAMTIFWGASIAEIALVFILSWSIQKLSAPVATLMFLAYSFLNGVTLSFILILFEVGSVAQAFVTATGMFAAISLYGLFTKRDLTSMGSFLFMGLVGLIIAMLVNGFIFQSTAMDLGISVIGVAIFLGLTAYDTQFLKEMGESVPHDDATAVRRGTIIGALKLYLDFINLFILLLRILGDRR